MKVFNFHAHFKPGESWLPNTHYCSANPWDWETLLNIHEEGARVSLGIHPWTLSVFKDDWLPTLEAKLRKFPQVQLGECGLDFARKGLEKEPQIRIFKAQLALAQKHQRTVSIHCVRAWGALEECLQDFPELNGRVLLHGFSGSKESASSLSKWGAHLSVGPQTLAWSAEKWAKKIPEGLALLPESDDLETAQFIESYPALMKKLRASNLKSSDETQKFLEESFQELFLRSALKIHSKGF